MDGLKVDIGEVAEDTVLWVRGENYKSERKQFRMEEDSKDSRLHHSNDIVSYSRDSIMLKFSCDLRENIIVFPMENLHYIPKEIYPSSGSVNRTSVIQRTSRRSSVSDESEESNITENSICSSLSNCDVCGERAGKHSYYGGQVCPSCRAFFRRSVQSNVSQSFKCSIRTGSCKITLKTRKSCQFCRYKQCLLSGMKPSWILSDEERKRRFGRGKKPGRNVQKKQDQNVKGDFMLGALYKKDNKFNDGKYINLKYGLKIKNGINNVLLAENIYFSDTHQEHINRLQLFNLVNQRFCLLISNILDEYFAHYEHFYTFSQETKASMSSKNSPLLYWLGVTTFKNNPTQQEGPLDLSMKSDKQQKPRTESDLENRLFNDNLIKDISDTVDTKDSDQLAFIFLLVTLNTDFLDLQDRRKIEELQLQVVLLLQDHLLSKHSRPVAHRKLMKVIMLPAQLRQLCYP